jgi:site-specific recombinase XerC
VPLVASPFQPSKQANQGYTISFNPRQVGIIILSIAAALIALQTYDDWRISQGRIKQIEHRYFVDPNKYLSLPKKLPKELPKW